MNFLEDDIEPTEDELESLNEDFIDEDFDDEDEWDDLEDYDDIDGTEDDDEEY